MKRFITIILALSIAFLGGLTTFAQEDFPLVISGDITSFAQEDYPAPMGDAYIHVEEAIEIEVVDSGYITQFYGSSEQSFEDYIVEKCLAQEPQINITSFNISKTDFANKYFDVIFRHPELMVSASVLPYVSGDKVVIIEPTYYFNTIEETQEARKQLDDKVSEYATLAQSAPDDLGKILLVHDKIAYDYYYDDDYKEEQESGDYFAHHPYGFILRGKAVCQGYAGLLYAVASKLGIEADFCKSDEINHIWNYVKIDGEWYHVDLTWDDPTRYADEEQTRIFRTAGHNNFLRSDEDFIKNGHGALSTYERYGGELYECNSTKFESNHLFNLSLFCLISYSDGSYSLPADSEVTFEYPTLYTGPMLVTKPYSSVLINEDGSSTPVLKIVYVHTGEAGREYISFARRIKDGAMAFGQSFLTTDTDFHYSLLRKNSDGAEYSFYFFDRTSLAPLSLKHSIVDN